MSASWLGNIRRATLWLMITTGSVSYLSASVKSRPAIIGTPRAAKNPGDTVRKRAWGSSSLFAFAYPSTVNWNPGPNVPASRQGTTVPIATRSTPGSSETRRTISL